MRLLNVYQSPAAESILWQLLSERQPHESISHKKMPTLKEHRAFINSRPYEAWYLVESMSDEAIVGAAYLTKQREIGIGILNQYKGRGFGKLAVKAVMGRHPGRLLANVNPKNTASVALFTGMGFTHVQNTYESPDSR